MQNLEVLKTLFMRYIGAKYKIGKPASMEVEIEGRKVKGGGMPIQEKDGSDKFDVSSPSPFFIVFVEGKNKDPLINIIDEEPTRSVIGALAEKILRGGTVDLASIMSLSTEIYNEIDGLPPHVAIVKAMEKLGEVTGEKVDISARAVPVKAIAHIGNRKKEFNEESLVVELKSDKGSLTIVAIPRNVSAKLNVKQAERWFK